MVGESGVSLPQTTYVKDYNYSPDQIVYAKLVVVLGAGGSPETFGLL